MIVTIIVIIILAAVVILTLSKNNPIGSSKEAVFKEDVRTFQDELAMYVAKDYTSKTGARDYKITETDSSKIKEYIPSFSKKYEGKFVIKNDELKYDEETVVGNEKEWCKSLNVKVNAKTGAEKAKEDPAKYYGEKVKYTAPNGVNDWKIFYSDGSNIYLITSEYVDPQIDNQLPYKDGARPDQGDANNYPRAARFNSILTKYNGSSDITDEKMKAFNSDYFNKNYSSGSNANFKAVAYMLDKEVWSELYSNSSVSEYAVGGPSLEMLFKSYCDKYPEYSNKYLSEATSWVGYKISKDGTNWSNHYWGVINQNDRLYLLPEKNTVLESGNKSGANAMWLSTPNDYSSGGNIYVMIVRYDSSVTIDGGGFSNASVGFRPIVCLNSNIMLTKNEETGDYEIFQ